jgi:carboxyl-terminal processing protease
MATVEAMFKRILTLLTGAMMGIAFVVAGARVAAAWNFWPNRDLSRAAGYVKDVMRLVNEHYVDENAA